MKKTITTIIVLATLAMNVFAQQVEIYPQIGQEVEISSITYSPDGRYVLTADRNRTSGVGNVKIWDAENGRELKTLYTGYRSANSRSFCNYAEYSPDGKTALLIVNGSEGSSYNYTNGSIRIVDVETGRTLRRISGHTGYVSASVFSSDGKRILSGGSDKTIKIWNVENGQEIRTITGHTDAVNSVAWGPGGRQLASSSADKDKTIRIWDADTGRQIRSVTSTNTVNRIKWSLDGRKILLGQESTVLAIDANTLQVIRGYESLRINGDVFSPDSQKIASISGGLTLAIYDINSGNFIRQIVNEDIKFSLSDALLTDASVAYRPDGRRIIASYANGSIRVLDVDSGKNLLTFGTRRVTGIPSAAWSPDGKQVAAASGRLIRIWDTTGRLIRTLSGHNADVGRVIWSPDGKRLASASSGETDRSVRIWDTESGRILRTITGPFSDDKEYGSTSGPTAIAWSPNGRMLATGSWVTVKVWDPETGRQQWTASTSEKGGGNWINRVSFSRDSQSLFTSKERIAVIYNAANGRELKTLEGNSIVFSPDEKQFVSASEGKGFWIYNAETGAQIRPGKMLSDYISSMSYSPDGKRVMISQGNGANIYDVETTNSVGSLSGHIASLYSASYSPDGKWILSASQDGSVRIWSAETFTEKARLIAFEDNEWLAMTPDGYYTASAKGDLYLNARVGNTVTGIDRYRSTFNKPAVLQARLSNSGRMASHKENITSVAVNPAGTRIASVALDKTIKIWDMESGKELRSISNIGGSVNAVSWSPDGKTLIHGAEDKTVRIWDAETGRALSTINGHSDYVNEARYSPDGKLVASCADDKLIKIWDAKSGKEQRTLSGHTDLVTVIAWSPNGKQLASGSDAQEKTIRIWDAGSGRLLQTISGQGGRIVALTYSPDGKKIASSTVEDKTIKIWDSETGRLIKSIPIENSGGVYSLAWSPDGKQLVSGAVYGGEDDYGTHIRIWNTETWERIRVIGENGAIYSISWTPDGRRIVAVCNFNDGQFIRVYDALSGNEL
jgi:WD40 repeat protein